jgi:hypothetical protein
MKEITKEENKRRCRHYTFEHESAGIMKEIEERRRINGDVVSKHLNRYQVGILKEITEEEE